MLSDLSPITKDSAVQGIYVGQEGTNRSTLHTFSPPLPNY